MREYDPANPDQKQAASFEVAASFDVPFASTVNAVDRRRAGDALILPNGVRLRPVVQLERLTDDNQPTGEILTPVAMQALGIVPLPGTETRVEL